MSAAPVAPRSAGADIGARDPRADYRPPFPLRAIGAVSTLFGVAAAVMILASVLITCHMIFVRGVLGQSTIWQTEAVIYLMIGATLLGLPYVQKLRGHVGVDLLPQMLPPALRQRLQVTQQCRPEDLDAWAEQGLRRSTSDPGKGVVHPAKRIDGYTGPVRR